MRLATAIKGLRHLQTSGREHGVDFPITVEVSTTPNHDEAMALSNHQKSFYEILQKLHCD